MTKPPKDPPPTHLDTIAETLESQSQSLALLNAAVRILMRRVAELERR